MGADSSCKSTLHALLHVSRDELIVKGGERLQEELLRMPISEVLVWSAPETGTESSERALFRIHTNTQSTCFWARAQETYIAGTSVVCITV